LKLRNILIRADASIKMGSGHVMRCLTLAEKLREGNNSVTFLSRLHDGNLNHSIKEKNFDVFELPLHSNQSLKGNRKTYLEWLGCTQIVDAKDCVELIQSCSQTIDLLIVDHYALDEQWEKALRPWGKKIMVIDDLADRKHDCDMLLDQTHGRKKSDYHSFVNAHTKLLMGSTFALLRQEFSEWRNYSLSRRTKPQLKQILITMGGVDISNVTGEILNIIEKSDLSKSIKIVVVMGKAAPYLKQIKQLANQLSLKVDVKVDVKNMAELMSNSDLAIGAAGSTAWERCCLGLPSIMIVLAKNQQLVAETLSKAGAAISIERNNLEHIVDPLRQMDVSKLKQIGDSAAKLVNGQGVSFATQELLSI
jgi:UDP-2,4-diacetamido-2,4,6-trideoxy-beta-L-altropyranose hydrolase